MENNLDRLCFGYGIKIPTNKEDQNVIQKALGVIEEDGVFAFKIYLDSLKQPESKKIANKIEENIEKMLKEIEIVNNFRDSTLKDLGSDLNKLFLTKELIERTLIYARYHAKGVE